MGEEEKEGEEEEEEHVTWADDRPLLKREVRVLPMIDGRCRESVKREGDHRRGRGCADADVRGDVART